VEICVTQDICNKQIGYLWLIISISLLVFWHIPSIFDFSALHVQAHIAQHISLSIVGATAFLATRSLGKSFLLLLLISAMGVMSFVGLLLSILQIPVYDVYSVHDHNDTGMYMIIMSIVMLLVAFPAYIERYIILKSRPKNSPTPYDESSLLVG
jgi:Protein of unknown function (DUF1404)